MIDTITDYIIKALGGSDMEIIVKVDQVTFHYGDVQESLAPIVCVLDDPDDPQVLSIGILPKGSEHYRRIDLFDGKGVHPENIDKFDQLARFFEYGILTIMNRRAFIRPKVTLMYGDTIATMFGGYEKGIFKQALEDAGAREVIFGPTS